MQSLMLMIRRFKKCFLQSSHWHSSDWVRLSLHRCLRVTCVQICALKDHVQPGEGVGRGRLGAGRHEDILEARTPMALKHIGRSWGVSWQPHRSRLPLHFFLLPLLGWTPEGHILLTSWSVVHSNGPGAHTAPAALPGSGLPISVVQGSFGAHPRHFLENPQNSISCALCSAYKKALPRPHLSHPAKTSEGNRVTAQAWKHPCQEGWYHRLIPVVCLHFKVEPRAHTMNQTARQGYTQIICPGPEPKSGWFSVTLS